MQRVELVGRATQLADVDRLLAAAQSGAGSVLLVAGDAGIGKSTYARALVERAKAAGARTAWGACLEGPGAAPYRPWLQVLRELGDPSPALAETNPTADTRYQLFDQIVDRLREHATETGLLIVLDDLHWADTPSMRLLHAVSAAVANSRLLVIALYRGRESFAYSDRREMLRVITRNRANNGFSLAPLAVAEVDALVELRLGHPSDEATRQAVHDRADGNPLFVEELLRLTVAGAEYRLPDNLLATLGRRLDQLTPATRQVLRCAAVLGRDCDLDLLTAVAGQPVLDSLAEAEAAKMVSRPDPRAVRFGHVLTREVLYGELSTSARAELHAKAAESLRDRDWDTDRDSLDALAHHLRQAAIGDDTAEALRVTRAAADRARRQLAFEHAAYQLREALGLLRPSARQGLRAELLLELAGCEFRAGAVEDAWRTCLAAADFGRADGDATVLADAATVLLGVSHSPVTSQLHALAREALAALGAADEPVRRARLLGQLAVTSDPFAGGATDGLSQLAAEAAARTDDPDARFLALQARQAELVDSLSAPDRLKIGERAVRLGEQADRPEYTAWGHAWRLGAHWELGDRIPLDDELAALAGLVDRLRDPLWQWQLLATQACLAMHDGRFTAAHDLADRALAIGRLAGHDAAEYMHLVFRANYGQLTGEGLDEVEAAVRQVAERGPFLIRAWHLGVLANLGHREEVAREWPSIAPHAAETPRGAPEWLIATAGNADLATLMGDHDAAARIYDVLLPYADRQVVVGWQTPSGGPVARNLGELATVLGNWSAAETHLRTAIASSIAMASAPYEALSRLATARTLLARGEAGDQAAAVAELDRAVALAGPLSMKPALTDAEALRAAAGGARSTRRTAEPD